MNFFKKNHKYNKVSQLGTSKKLITLLVLLAFISNVDAQWFGKKIKGNGNVITKTRSVGEYDKVSVAGSFDVKLVAGVEGKITIKADENLLEYLVTEVKSGDLKIKWKKGINVSTKKAILVTVPFKNIESVSLAGSGDVYSEDVIKTDSFNTALAGSGDIKLKVSADNISAAISGSGDIVLSGNSGSIKCSIAGSGDFHGYELTAKSANVSIAGSGGMKISVSDNLKARISGSGNIYYKGNPRQDVKVSGSGNVSSH